jgi:hypothetical protein
VKFITILSINEGRNLMRRFEFWLPKELYDRIKLMAKFYNKPVSKTMIELLEIGYIRKHGGDVK